MAFVGQPILIGIGGTVAHPPLPHHRTYGSSSAAAIHSPGVISNAYFTGNPSAIGSVVKGGNAVTYLSPAKKAQFSRPGFGDPGASRNTFTAARFFQMVALHKYSH